MIPPSFLPLQVAIYFSGWYLCLLYIAELALVIYKGKSVSATKFTYIGWFIEGVAIATSTY